MINPAVRWLVLAYAALSLLTVALIGTFSLVAPRLVSHEAWVRGTVVAATSVLTVLFADRAAKGRPRALLRLRIVVPVILVAIVAVPLFVHLPAWMVAEQALCGALLLATAALLFGPPARSG
jgi:hypothetical protein